MSVLVKGMEMPKNCVDCRFHKSLYCMLTDICTNSAQGCPLVEVPTPHGRLIDADALLKCIPNEELNSKMAVAYAPTVIEAEE